MTNDGFVTTSKDVADLIADFTASPTPYHAVERAAFLLSEAGFISCDETERLPTDSGGYYLARGGTLFAWIQPKDWLGFTVVGAHTDSPNLRVRRNPDRESAGVAQIGMEIYGGVLLNSWLDRDLGLAGRVEIANETGSVSEKLISERRALLRIPQLAIHLHRDIHKDGLLLDPHKHMIPMWSTSPDEQADFRSYIADLAGCRRGEVLSWDLMAFDIQQASLAGRYDELFVSARIDNLYSSFAAVRSMCSLGPEANLGADGAPQLPVLALFDHEEVGSRSSTGADGSFLLTVLERIALAAGRERADFLQDMANTFVLSVDGAHATHPNYAGKHDKNHNVALNAGVVIKRNAKQRYATDAQGEARVVKTCQDAGIPYQFYIHRNDLPCGSTIGPTTAAKLAATTVDVGAPQLAMHSIRETAGIEDFGHLSRLIRCSWQAEP